MAMTSAGFIAATWYKPTINFGVIQSSAAVLLGKTVWSVPATTSPEGFSHWAFLPAQSGEHDRLPLIQHISLISSRFMRSEVLTSIKGFGSYDKSGLNLLQQNRMKFISRSIILCQYQINEHKSFNQVCCKRFDNVLVISRDILIRFQWIAYHIWRQKFDYKCFVAYVAWGCII